MLVEELQSYPFATAAVPGKLPTGISNREAKRRKRVADVVGKVKGALEKLASGSVSSEHIGALAPVADMPGAASLLDDAASTSPEEFANAVEQFRLSASCGEVKTNEASPHSTHPSADNATEQQDFHLSGRTETDLCAHSTAESKLPGEHHSSLGSTAVSRSAERDQETNSDNYSEVETVHANQNAENLSAPLTSPAFQVEPIGQRSYFTQVKTGKPAVVIVFDVDKWEARIAGGGPIPITDTLLDQARNDLYYCFKNMAGEVLKFGRSRRDPTPVQRLVLVVRDERCLYPGCHAPPERCDAHHTNE